MKWIALRGVLFSTGMFFVAAVAASGQQSGPLGSSAVALDAPAGGSAFPLIADGKPVNVLVDPKDFNTVQVAAKAFAEDLQRVSGGASKVMAPKKLSGGGPLVIVGSVGQSGLIDDLRKQGKLDTKAIEGKWESSITEVVSDPMPGVSKALVVVGSDHRGAAYGLFTLSRLMGVSPWYWWADVPVKKHTAVSVAAGVYVQGEPSVKYRGIFLNDEDFGLRPWASKGLDSGTNNIGPNTYGKICELLLRLHANLLWPAMHPGTTAFHKGAGNAEVADQWGIVMGSSHSEVLLRDNPGEWDRKMQGDWNYQTNDKMMREYWEDGLKQSGRYENEYTVGLRGFHDSGLEATGSKEVKAALVDEATKDEREILKKALGDRYKDAEQVLWLYKESIDLYRVGMKVPDDVTLGWTDDNFGYIRQLPNAEEQKRKGGSAVYYHVSYWGPPHDHLWLCTTPPALMREELTKAYDHGVQRLWVLNVGDLKPAESDMDYFLSLAWDVPQVRQETQHEFLTTWATEQLGAKAAPAIAEMWEKAYALNFVRKPEFMGFNGYDDDVRHGLFNPYAWGDQAREREMAWNELSDKADEARALVNAAAYPAYFQLVQYNVQAEAAHNEKFFQMDRELVDSQHGDKAAADADFQKATAAYQHVQQLTATFNGMENGKWKGMMSSHPRNRHVFDPPSAEVIAQMKVPVTWVKGANGSAASSEPGFREVNGTISINAMHFAHASEGWTMMPELGITGGSVTYGAPGKTPAAAWLSGGKVGANTPVLEYKFDSSTDKDASLNVDLLPTFALDSTTALRYAVQIDDKPVMKLDASGSEQHREGITTWSSNVVSNMEVQTVPLGALKPGPHVLRVFYGDSGVVFENLTVTFPDAVPAYPVAPETGKAM